MLRTLRPERARSWGKPTSIAWRDGKPATSEKPYKYTGICFPNKVKHPLPCCVVRLRIDPVELRPSNFSKVLPTQCADATHCKCSSVNMQLHADTGQQTCSWVRTQLSRDTAQCCTSALGLFGRHLLLAKVKKIRIWLVFSAHFQITVYLIDTEENCIFHYIIINW